MFEKNSYQFFSIVDIQGDILICNRYGKFPATFVDTPELNWSSIGVFKRGGTTSNEVKIFKKSVSGKVIAISNLLITCPINILREK